MLRPKQAGRSQRRIVEEFSLEPVHRRGCIGCAVEARTIRRHTGKEHLKELLRHQRNLIRHSHAHGQTADILLAALILGAHHEPV